MGMTAVFAEAAERALALPAGEAVFDLDGTLIHGDISESALALLSPPGWDWDAYHALVATDDPEAKTRGSITQGVLAAQAFAGLTVLQMNALVDEAFVRGLVRPHEEVIALARALAEKHRVWILTGSPELLGWAVAPRIGIPNVIGLRTEMVGGRLTDQVIPPVTIATGKVTAAWVALGRRPVFAIGDSPWDLPLLHHAHTRLGIGRIAGVV